MSVGGLTPCRQLGPFSWRSFETDEGLKQRQRNLNMLQIEENLEESKRTVNKDSSVQVVMNGLHVLDSRNHEKHRLS